MHCFFEISKVDKLSKILSKFYYDSRVNRVLSIFNTSANRGESKITGKSVVYFTGTVYCSHNKRLSRPTRTRKIRVAIHESLHEKTILKKIYTWRQNAK